MATLAIAGKKFGPKHLNNDCATKELSAWVAWFWFAEVKWTRVEEQRAAQISIMARERVDAERNTKQQMLEEGASVGGREVIIIKRIKI